MSLQGEREAGASAHPMLSRYRPVEGVPDELIGPDGRPRDVWARLVETVSGMSAEELATRMARGDQYLRDAGVFYRQYGAQETSERDWPLSHMPVLISESEWSGISQGLMQRADVLEAFCRDLYGENRLVREGHIPASLVAGNPEWLRPLVGIKPRSGHYLHFIAFDIGRGPDGDWWVLGDRTSAPSGAGFALENRIASSRIFTEHFSRHNVHRLAGFFKRFRDSLLGLREGDDSRVGILTPGPMNDTYFEHAYIARYLGFMLLEGEDLAVVDGKLMVRTVAGFRPISVLWRRLDSAWMDPLHLKEDSRIGTPGLLGAIGSGSVTMVNALGSGVLETRAFLAFLPRISEMLQGESLSLPNIATWWCGQAAEREYVKANAERMTIGDALSTRMLFDHDDISVVGGRFNRETRQTVDAWIDYGAGGLVGQEAVSLSTTPAFDDGALVPRPMSLRVFLARSPDGWAVMPGGLARIGRAGETVSLALQKGGSAADVWVVGDGPVSTESIVDDRGGAFTRQPPGTLPSRAAENLFWLGRYIERAENTLRILRIYHVRVAEMAEADKALLDHIAAYLEGIGIDGEQGIPRSLTGIVKSANAAASHVRDRLSVDGWLALDDLSKVKRELGDTVSSSADEVHAANVLLRKISGFSGLVHENMYRFTGWRFLCIGRSMERSLTLTSLLGHFASPDAPEGSLDLVVETADSSMSHRRRYAVSTNRATVVDLLALDPLNPRSVVYQLREMSSHIDFLPGSEPHRQLSALQRSMLDTQSYLEMQTAETLDTDALYELSSKIAGLSDHLASAYLR